MSMPYPCVSVGELIKSLSCLDPESRIALVEVQEEWGYNSPLGVTTLTLKVWGGLTLPPACPQAAIAGPKKTVAAKQARIACSTSR